jgi:cell wall assembly regulator SMI1
MTVANEVRTIFAGHSFGAPCTEADIHRAERALGELLPPVLRELYLAFDGFRGSTDAAFFWSLFGREGLVEMNQFFRVNQFFRGDDLFPRGLVSQCLFFGDNGAGPQWGFKRDLPGKIIQWDAAWGTYFEVVGDSPLDVWRAEKQLYDNLGEEV